VPVRTGAGREGPLRRESAVITTALAAAALVLALAALSAAVTGRDAGFFMREPQDVLGGPWYAGSVALLNGLAWWTAGVAAALGAICFWRRGAAPYAVAASLSVLLCLDDILLLHDDFYPRLGVNELAASAVYMLVYLVYVPLARAIWTRRGWLGLLVTPLLLGTSVLADTVVQPLVGRELPLLEDGAKLAGAFVWATVQMRLVSLELKPGTAVGAR
jgi:hypothetical protein